MYCSESRWIVNVNSYLQNKHNPYVQIFQYNRRPNTHTQLNLQWKKKKNEQLCCFLSKKKGKRQKNLEKIRMCAHHIYNLWFLSTDRPYAPFKIMMNPLIVIFGILMYYWGSRNGLYIPLQSRTVTMTVFFFHHSKMLFRKFRDV